MTTRWQMSVPEKYLLNYMPNTIHIDLGCGALPRNPLGAKHVFGIDVLAEPVFKTVRDSLEYKQVFHGLPLPFESNQVDSISAFDFLEHIPRSDRLPNGGYTNPFIEIMNEVYRILKPGGIFIALTPCFPSSAAFTDPTHVNFITEETHLYFSGPNYARTKGYGFNGEFNVVEADWSDWKGYLWDTHASEAKGKDMPSVSVPKPKSQSVFKQIKFALRRRITGHTGETHFIWVLEKPNN